MYLLDIFLYLHIISKISDTNKKSNITDYNLHQ